MSITQKILAAHAGRISVEPGEIINVQVDLVMANEMSGFRAIEEFENIEGATHVFDSTKVVFVPDHSTPNRDIVTAQMNKKVREFARRHQAVYFEVGRAGIEHVLIPEQGLAAPGDVIIGGDSHTCTYGAMGAFSTGVGATDVAGVLALGEIWLKVPHAIKLVYTGKLRKWVSGKDLILHTIGTIGVDGATYQTLEFTGDLIAELSMADRFTMANMAVEAGAKSGIFGVDAKTIAYYETAGQKPYTVFESDPDAQYSQIIEIDANEIEPQVAFPHLPENTRAISQVGDVAIDQVVIGSCTNGRLEDLRAAAAVLKGRKVHPGVRTLVIPGTAKVYAQALQEGLLQVFLDSDCAVTPPTCGPCAGGHMGILAEGERCVSTTNRNFVGRMGHTRSEVYLANPVVAAASAVAGRIVSPEEL